MFQQALESLETDSAMYCAIPIVPAPMWLMCFGVRLVQLEAHSLCAEAPLEFPGPQPGPRLKDNVRALWLLPATNATLP